MAQLPTVEAIRNELAANLVVTTVISQRTGSQINIGETFKINVQVHNDLLYVDAAFTDVWVFVTGTAYAAPTAPTSGAQVNVSLGSIPWRSSKSATIEFKALQKIPYMPGVNLPEPVANIRVRAQFAIQQLFGNIWQNQTFYTQIESI